MSFFLVGWGGQVEEIRRGELQLRKGDGLPLSSTLDLLLHLLLLDLLKHYSLLFLLQNDRSILDQTIFKYPQLEETFPNF